MVKRHINVLWLFFSIEVKETISIYLPLIYLSISLSSVCVYLSVCQSVCLSLYVLVKN